MAICSRMIFSVLDWLMAFSWKQIYSGYLRGSVRCTDAITYGLFVEACVAPRFESTADAVAMLEIKICKKLRKILAGMTVITADEQLNFFWGVWRERSQVEVHQQYLL